MFEVYESTPWTMPCTDEKTAAPASAHVDVDHLRSVGDDCTPFGSPAFVGRGGFAVVEESGGFVIEDEEDGRSVSTVPRSEHLAAAAAAAVPGRGPNGRAPWTLDVHTGDGTWLTVVEEFAQLPAARSAAFSTTEVWRPIGVYAGDAFLGEIRLREPRGYDGGLRTAVRVVVSARVDEDLLCSVTVDCTLFGPAVFESEVVEHGRDVVTRDVVGSGYRVDGGVDEVTAVTAESDTDLATTAVLLESRDRGPFEAIVVDATSGTGVYANDERRREVSASTTDDKRGTVNLHVTVNRGSRSASSESAWNASVSVAEDGDDDVTGVYEYSADEERPSHSSCDRDDMTINVIDADNIHLPVTTVLESAYDTIHEEIVKETLETVVDLTVGIYEDDGRSTVTDSDSTGEHGSEDLSMTVNYDSSSETPSGMSIYSLSAVEDRNDGVREAVEQSADEDPIVYSVFYLLNMKKMAGKTRTVDTVSKSEEDEIPEAVGENEADVGFGTRYDWRGNIIPNPVTVPAVKKKKKSFMKRVWSWIKKKF